MARISPFRWIGLAALGFSLVGCVSQDQYNALKLERDRMAEQLVSSQRDAGAAKSAADAYKAQYDQLAASGDAKGGLLTNLSSQVATLTAQNEDLNRRYQELLSQPHGGAGPLPRALTDELNQFAQQNPDLVDFDSARGIVKFKSDVVFGVGDATLTAKARDVIDKFARILNSAGASQYELLVAGHTDNAPVHNQATINAGHKDNWYLSAHRAISVSNELQKTGVSSSRIGVLGYADQHPIASNGSESGKQQNRRVEVLILPTTVHVGSSPSLAGQKRPSGPARPNGLNKDSASTPTGPVLNK